MESDANLLDIAVECDNIGTPVADELTSVLAAFERATGLQACFKSMTDRWRDAAGSSVVREPFIAHRSAFCRSVKAELESACFRCDNADLPAACGPAGQPRLDPFVRTCHAGAEELLLPIWSQGALVAVLFVGQFTRTLDVPGRPRLQRLRSSDVRHLRTLLVAVRSYFHDALRRLDAQRHAPEAGRRAEIEAYLRERLSDGLTLAGLASHLSLSRSRASHVVKETTGRSFQQLVEERRITVAKDLLASTHAPIAWVALQVGFDDIGYFCRYFKRKTGFTPGTFRQRHHGVVSV